MGASFESLDTDRDGRISRTEAATSTTLNDQFSRYDKNGNGYIERKEATSAGSSSSKPGQQQ